MPKKLKKSPQKNPPNVWDSVRKRNGKLSGMLTDTLASNIFNFVYIPISSNIGRGLPTTVVKSGKVPKKYPSKFK